ncbi:uncharacterized protein LOC136040779 isoform X2 [Artemia franciscana]|uniref:uncharacterized protein LOC136040779 isoform X2 n=1 Tax=Artemia franciscana TaxID=6661 RepID=UPI0032DB069A
MDANMHFKKNYIARLEEDIHQSREFFRLCQLHAIADEKDTLRIYHVCPTSEMNDVKAMPLYDASDKQLRKLIISKKIKEFAFNGVWHSVCNYLFFLMGISSDESVIYHCSNLLEELTSFTCNEWAPTTSDLLAVLVNQGANGFLLSKIPAQTGIMEVKMPNWIFTIGGSNGEKPAFDEFSINLKLILDFFSVDMRKRNVKYGQTALLQFLHMFISVICSEVYTNNPAIFKSGIRSINVILNAIKDEIWEFKGYTFVAALANSYAPYFVSNPERTNFFSQFISSCKPRGLLLSRFFARTVISLLTKSKVDFLTFPTLQNVAEIVQNADDLEDLSISADHIWLCIQCLEAFEINEKISSTNLVTLRYLHSWLEEQMDKMMSGTRKFELASLEPKVTNLLQHWRKIIALKSQERRLWVMK